MKEFTAGCGLKAFAAVGFRMKEDWVADAGAIADLHWLG
jgi:hypothetical protein